MPTTRGGLEPATISNKTTGEITSCMFNPFEYTISKQNQYENAETKGRNIPRVRFRQGGAQTLTLKLLFDTYGEASDVRTLTGPLWRMMMIDETRPTAAQARASRRTASFGGASSSSRRSSPAWPKS